MATLTNSEFYIIVAAEAYNEVANPSIEKNTNGHTSVGSGTTISRSIEEQLHGAYSMKVTPGSGVEAGAYYETVNEISGETRTFSVGVKGVAGQSMRVQIRTTADVMLSETAFVATGYWQRIKVTRVGTANAARRLYVVRDAVASTAPFYLDGFYYSTVDGTYLDGDMTGFVTGKRHYRWLGEAHASQSWRSGQTRSGGTLLRIKDFARILSILGLGMAPVSNIAQSVVGDYSIYQMTRVENREYILNLAFVGLTPGEIQASRQMIIDAIDMDKVAFHQPLVIRYQGYDNAGNDASEPLDIISHYVDGLQNQPQQPAIERAPVRFACYLPFLQSSGSRAVELGYQTTVANFANVGFRDTDGAWKALGTGVNGITQAIRMSPDGALYVGGGFTLAGGVANTSRIAKWDGTAWSALGTGVNNTVYAIAIGPDGSVYVGGSFTSAGGVPNTTGIARWNGSSWSALGTGVTGTVNALSFGLDGSLYVGGWFSSAGGVANTIGIAKWDGLAWSALGTGGVSGAGIVYALATGLDGSLYAGGSFNTMGSVTNANKIAKWDGSVWSPLGTGINSTVFALAIGPDGSLYAGGNFTLASGVANTNRLARWDGLAWSALGTGADAQVTTIYFGPDGTLYLGGQFTTLGGISLPSSGGVYHNGVWAPLDIDIPYSPAYFEAFFIDPLGRLFVGGQWSGTDALSATVIAQASGGARAYPVITFSGPGRVWQLKNYTTDKAIYLNSLTLLADEQVVLDLRPGSISFNSSFRGNLMPYVLPGSDMDFFLLGTGNYVSSFMTDTSGSSAILMTWNDLYWSIDGAKR